MTDTFEWVAVEDALLDALDRADHSSSPLTLDGGTLDHVRIATTCIYALKDGGFLKVNEG